MIFLVQSLAPSTANKRDNRELFADEQGRLGKGKRARKAVRYFNNGIENSGESSDDDDDQPAADDDGGNSPPLDTRPRANTASQQSSFWKLSNNLETKNLKRRRRKSS